MVCLLKSAVQEHEKLALVLQPEQRVLVLCDEVAALFITQVDVSLEPFVEHSPVPLALFRDTTRGLVGPMALGYSRPYQELNQLRIAELVKKIELLVFGAAVDFGNLEFGGWGGEIIRGLSDVVVPGFVFLFLG